MQSTPGMPVPPKRNRKILIAIIAIVVIVAAVLGYVYLLPKNTTVSLSETGSSLMYPLFNLWVPNYTATHGGVQISTLSTGSGTGISQATSGAVQIGASDAYLSSSQVQPGLLNIALAISAQQVNYNLPGMNNIHVNFTGDILSAIYNGSITYWDDSHIKQINPGVASTLPHNTIIPIKRSDSSGDTFLFTSYLTKSSNWWSANCGFSTAVLPAKTSCTIAGNAVAAQGNSGMVTACQQNAYSIAYIGISFLNTATNAGLGYAYLQNHDLNFVDISQPNILAAADQLASSTPANETISMIYAPGANSYPIVNYEYAIVKTHQSSQAVANAVKQFLSWCIDPTQGNSAYFLNQVKFNPLPAAVETLSQNQINSITYP